VQTGTGSSFSGTLAISLPVASFSDYVIGDILGTSKLLHAATSEFVAMVAWTSTTTIELVTLATNTGANPVFIDGAIGSRAVTATSPFTWGTSGDTFQWSMVYESAT
jgi:hypothetical protein